jgi:type II secretory pathway pseudopilin PulG
MPDQASAPKTLGVQSYLGIGLVFACSFLNLSSCFLPQQGHGEDVLLKYMVCSYLNVLGLVLFARSLRRPATWGLLGFLGPGAIVGIPWIAMVVRRADESPQQQRPRWADLLTVGAGVILFTVLAAIAIPNFLNYGARARNAEARTNLGGVFVSETAFQSEKGRYGSFHEIGFIIPPGYPNRYTYRSPAPGGAGPSSGTVGVDLYPSHAPSFITQPENAKVPSSSRLAKGNAPAQFTATAVGDIDSDPVLDQWHVNDQKQGLQWADVDDLQ